MSNFVRTLAILFLLSCSGPSDKLILPRKNCTGYVFDAPIENIMKTIEKSLSNHEFRKMQLSKHGMSQINDTLDIFNSLGNESDYLLLPMPPNYTIGESSVLPGKYYMAKFHLHLSSINVNQTKVEIKTINPMVLSGKKLSAEPKYAKVEPSTVEEYEILLIIGKGIGQKYMPEIVYPIDYREFNKQLASGQYHPPDSIPRGCLK